MELKRNKYPIWLIKDFCKIKFSVPYKLRHKKFHNRECADKNKNFHHTSETKKHLSLKLSGSGNPRYHAIVTDLTRQKMSEKLKGKFLGCTRSEEFKRKVSETKKKKFANGETKIWRQGLTNKTDNRIANSSKKLSKILKDKFKSGELEIWSKGLTKFTDERVRKNSIAVSKALKAKFANDPIFKKKQALVSAHNWLNGYNFPNKVEQKVQQLLPSTFVGNQFIENLQVDFVDYDRKIIVEVNGDFWHMNPELFESNYYNKVMGMTAKEIWNREQEKITRLKNMGYEVITIWESDINKGDFSKLNKVTCQ